MYSEILYNSFLILGGLYNIFFYDQLIFIAFFIADRLFDLFLHFFQSVHLFQNIRLFQPLILHFFYETVLILKNYPFISNYPSNLDYFLRLTKLLNSTLARP